MGYIKHENGDVEQYDSKLASELREIAVSQSGYQPEMGDKVYVAGANGTVYTEKWFETGKRMAHIALMRIGNVSPTKEGAKKWYQSYGKAFIVDIHDL